jgi:hypothetical protein
MTEYGVDSYDSINNREDQDSQASFISKLYSELVENAKMNRISGDFTLNIATTGSRQEISASKIYLDGMHLDFLIKRQMKSGLDFTTSLPQKEVLIY